jgi:hypothetical protein
MRLTKTQTQLKRQAIVMDVGGFRPPEDPFASWFGKVNLALPHEEWPECAGEKMHALCQINLTEMPFRPPNCHDLAMITVFIGPSVLPVDQPNGNNWCLRAYSDLSLLRPLKAPPERSPIKAFPLKSRIVEADFPCLDDVSESGLDVGDEDTYVERCPNVPGLKFGGWPSLIQSTVEWSEEEDDQIKPQYVFQIDSCEKAHWQWGDGGVGYFGRGCAEGFSDYWVMSWQCL